MSESVTIDVTKEVEIEVDVNIETVTCACGKELEFSADSRYEDVTIEVEPHECHLTANKATIGEIEGVIAKLESILAMMKRGE